MGSPGEMMACIRESFKGIQAPVYPKRDAILAVNHPNVSVFGGGADCANGMKAH